MQYKVFIAVEFKDLNEEARKEIVPGEGEGADQERADAEQPQRVHGQAPGDHSH